MRSAVVKEHGLCSNSLSNDHMLNKFKSEISCKVKSYDKRQHTLLHNPNYARGNKDSKDAKANESIDGSRNQNTHYQNLFETTTTTTTTTISLLQFNPVIFNNGNRTITINALLGQWS